MLMKLTPDEESDNVIALLFKECKTSGAEEDLHYNFEEFNYDYQHYNSFNLHSRNCENHFKNLLASTC